MTDNCGHCLSELTSHPNVCTTCRQTREYCSECIRECSVKEHKKKIIIDVKGTECEQYCPKCKTHTDLVLKGFKDPQHDPWCIALSINSNKPKDENFMPFTKHNRLIVEEQLGEYPEKSGRNVKGGAVRNMEERYYEKIKAWDAGKYCGGY